MSGLIKQAQADLAIDRLPFVVSRPAGPPPRDPRIDALETRVAELEAAITSERREAERAIAAARDAGRDEAMSGEAERNDRLERGIAEAVTAWRDRLAGIDGLAATLAAVAIGKMFGDSPDLVALTARTLRHHLDRLEREAVVHVAVAAADFPDPAAVAALASQAGLAGADVEAREELPSGTCRVALRLGAVELDPLGQWAVIERALLAMGEAA